METVSRTRAINAEWRHESVAAALMASVLSTRGGRVDQSGAFDHEMHGAAPGTFHRLPMPIPHPDPQPYRNHGQQSDLRRGCRRTRRRLPSGINPTEPHIARDMRDALRAPPRGSG